MLPLNYVHSFDLLCFPLPPVCFAFPLFSLSGIYPVGSFWLLFLTCSFSALPPSFWWQLHSILLCLINVGMLILFPVYFVPSQPAVLGLPVFLEGACGCVFCLQWLCSWVWLLFPDPQNALFFLPTLYMNSASLQEPSNDCIAVYHFSDANFPLKVVS